MDLQKVISYVVVASLTGYFFGRHVYQCSIDPTHPDKGGDMGAAIMQGVMGGLFWQITWLWAIYKALTHGNEK